MESAAVARPVGILGGVYLSEYGNGWLGQTVRYCGDLLNCVPSIVVGIFVFTVVVAPMKRFSWLAGSVALSLIAAPSVMRSTEDFLRLAPVGLREAAWALGAARWSTIATVLLPAAARISSETAPLLFTSFSNRFPAANLSEPVASMPGMIFSHAISPYEDWRRQAWAAALVLLVIVLLFNGLSRVLTPTGGRRR